MKQLSLMLLLCVSICLSLPAQQAKKQNSDFTFAAKGIHSPDTENEQSMKDPVYVVKTLPVEKSTATTLPNAKGTPLTTLKDAEAIGLKIAHKIMAKALHFNLLSQHKYMINNCLGIKASAGNFSMKLSNPFVKVEQSLLYMKFTIDKVNMDVLAIRMRPCPKDAQCHFGSAFEVRWQSFGRGARNLVKSVCRPKYLYVLYHWRTQVPMENRQPEFKAPAKRP